MKTGGLGAPQFIIKDKFSHNIPLVTSVLNIQKGCLYGAAKQSHRHLNIQKFVFLNPCPKFNNQCIDLNNIKMDSINTCEHLCPLQCAKMYPEVLAERSLPSWITTNPLLMPHISQEKCDKTHESPTYWGLEELPIS